MQNITAGAFTNLLNRILDAFLKNIEDITLEGDWDTKTKDLRDGTKSFGTETIYTRKKWANGDEVTEPDAAVLVVNYYLPFGEDLKDETIKMLQKDPKFWKDAEDVQIEITYKGGNNLSKKNLTMQQANKEFESYKKKFSIASEATKIILTQLVIAQSSVNSSKKLQMSLTKIAGSKNVDINLTKINANYDLLEAIDDVNTIVEDDEFVESLPENEEVSYEVITGDDEDEYDVNLCDGDFSTIECIQSMIAQSLQLQLKLRTISLEITGDQCDNIFTLCDNIIYTIDDIMLTLSNMLISNQGCTTVIPDVTVLDACTGRDISEPIIDSIEKDVRAYLDCLDVIYINCSRGEQGQLESYIRDIEASLRDAKRRV